jgi:uncharacterized protein (TIGR04551 family)
MSWSRWLVPLLVCLLQPAGARATGFTDIGQDIEAQSETTFLFHGALRVRGELLYNLDLDRGPTPSGQLLFPVPLADPTSQWLTHADLRLRTDLAAYLPVAGLAVKLRMDVLDNLGLGSTPAGTPSTTTTQGAPPVALRVKRAYGEVLLPFGLLAAGRMGAHWGLGMLSNGGDCADCDSGDSADRIALITPLLGHLWALAYDFSSSGPFSARHSGQRTIDLDPTDDLRSVTLAFLAARSDQSRERRRAAGKATVEYGLSASYRWQDNDVPASYLSLASPVPLTSAQVMSRGLKAAAFDAWFRLTLPALRLEAEAAVLLAEIRQTSLVPGALLHEPMRGTQVGAALETEWTPLAGRLGVGLDFGFGAFPGTNQAAPRAGDLDGPQASPPWDNRVDNFRFHPDYRIDRILFREIVGTVTDAFYFRPHLRCRLLELGPGALSVSLAAVASFAVEPESTPGMRRPLGIELDPTLAYENALGFSAVLEYAALFPLAGLDNAQPVMKAKAAQLLRLRLLYRF